MGSPLRWLSIVVSIGLVLFNISGLPYPGAYDNLLIVVGFAFNGVWQPSQQQNGAKCPDVPASMHTLQLAEDSASACQQTCLSYAQYHKFFLGYAGKDFCCQYKESNQGVPGQCRISEPITAVHMAYQPDREHKAFFFHPWN